MSRDSVEAAVSQFSLEYRVGPYDAGPNSIAVPFAPALLRQDEILTYHLGAFSTPQQGNIRRKK